MTRIRPRSPALLLALGACTAPHSALDPRSDAAEAIAQLWWLLLAVCVAVFVVVLGLYAWALWRHRGDGHHGSSEDGTGKLVVLGGAVIPAVILAGLTTATILTSSRAHHEGRAEGAEPVVIEVTGHQFWWEVRYPGTGVVTANEIHLPAGRPARLLLRSADVIHSFWVPQLHGKMDLIPGRENELVLEPREAGVYRGFCTEFCGRQHALMGLLVIAEPVADFERWLSEQAGPARQTVDPRAEAGEAVFVANQCHLCHHVRGAAYGPPPAVVGPDLTHLASRGTLAAATVTNDRANLTAWILDPHSTKPGVRMPATALSAEDLNALIRYLEGLR